MVLHELIVGDVFVFKGEQSMWEYRGCGWYSVPFYPEGCKWDGGPWHKPAEEENEVELMGSSLVRAAFQKALLQEFESGHQIVCSNTPRIGLGWDPMETSMTKEEAKRRLDSLCD